MTAHRPEPCDLDGNPIHDGEWWNMPGTWSDGSPRGVAPSADFAYRRLDEWHDFLASQQLPKTKGNGKSRGSEQAPRDRPRIELVPFDGIQISGERNYLVKGLIPRTGLVVVWGPPKCGKSFWTFDLVMHVALDWEYRGRRVTQGPIVYVACEGAAGLRQRVEAFRSARMSEDTAGTPFYLVPTRLSLVDEKDELISAIRTQLGNERPVAVVLDTLNRSMRGSESSDEDMGAYIAAADAIREAFECAVIVVHHCGIEGTRPRGHTSLTGAVDAQLAVSRNGSDVITTTLEFMKDGPEGDVLASRLEVVEVGTDEDGDAISSCVVVPVEAGQHWRAPHKLSERQRLALGELHNCLADHGKPAPASNHIPTSAIIVDVNQWRENLFAAGVLDPEAANPRQDFRRVLLGLKGHGAIGTWNEHVWTAQP